MSARSPFLTRWFFSAILCACVLLISPARAAIAYVASSNTNSGGATSNTMSWTHALGNPSGNKRLVIVGVTSENGDPAAQVINSITFNGVAMTAVAGATGTNGSNRIDMYYILDANLPASAGSYTITVNYGGSVTHTSAGAIELSGVAQGAREAVATSTASSANSISTSVTTLTADAWVVSMLGASEGTTFGLTVSTANSTERWENASSTALAAGSTLATTTTGSKTVTWTGSASINRWAQSLAAFAPATATVSGTVYEDVTYAGGSGRTLAASSGSARSGARVELYNASDTFLSFATTDVSGNYSFAGLSLSTTYKIRVVNSTVTSSLGGTSLIPVQTFRTTATTGSAVAVTDRVGGEDPMKADQGNGSTTLPATTGTLTVQSITSVAIGTSDVTGINFGYNFNTIVNTNDSGQGSLRQMITNANGMTGTQTTQFMISGGSAVNGLRAGLTNQLTSGVAIITPVTVFPTISGTLVFDGTTQTTNVGNTNAGTFGTGGTVGVDGLTLSTVNRPEVQIVGNSTLPTGLLFTADNSTLKGISIHGFGDVESTNNADVRFFPSADCIITQNFFGFSATSFSAPAAITGRTSLRVDSSTNPSITNNLFGYGGYNGLAIRSGATGALIENNEFRGFGVLKDHGEAISLSDNSTSTVRGNLLAANRSAAIDLWSSLSSSNTVINNTITGNAIGAGITELFTINVAGSNNTIDRNRIYQNYGAGIVVATTGANNKITQNSIYLNGTITNNGGSGPLGDIGIDLLTTGSGITLNDDGDADTGGNNALNFPILDSATIIGSNLEITGWAPTGSTIEFFVSDGDSNNFGEGQTYFATYTEGGGSDTDATTSSYSGNINCIAQGAGTGASRFKFTFAKPGSVSLLSKLTATATDGSNNTSEFSGQVTVNDGPDFSIVKSSQVVSDPINATTNPKAIPGAVILYSLLITNTDGSRGDNNSLIFTDPIPANSELYVGDLGGASSGPVSFTDGATTSALTYTFTSLASTTDDVSFSNDGGTTWTYTPTPDVDGFDATVTHLRVNPKGAFARAECGNNPSCTLRFRIRVK
jgi:parallel beta-helix repeat protein